MTTLTAMKARIASELRRSDLTTQIASAISTAIEAHRDERWFWTERRDVTFTTVIDQEFYDSDDQAQIANLIKIDYLKLIVGNTVFDLLPDRPAEIEGASTNATSTGQPGWFVFYQRQIRLYPIPAGAWTVRIAGQFIYAAPATDDEADNFWMTKAERLVRSRANAIVENATQRADCVKKRWYCFGSCGYKFSFSGRLNSSAGTSWFN